MTTTIQGYDPRTGSPTGPAFPTTTPEALEQAVHAARDAFPVWSGLPARRRADVLDAVADALDAAATDLVDVADAETALGRPRLTGEVARTTGQLRMFARVLRQGDHVGAILTPADASTGRGDIRRMLLPVGPVAVFSASNFPFAFSVAGGDTASALAAGCPVLVKAHEGHPATSAAVAAVISGELSRAGLPAGVFSLVQGFDAGPALVRHPSVRAVGFTGSLRGGRALFDLAAGREDPIPFYGELGSINPVVVLPAAARDRTAEIAGGYAASLTQGTGQFCTNPGLLFLPEDSDLATAIADAVGRTSGGPVLTGRIRDSYRHRVAELDATPGLVPLASGAAAQGEWAVTPRIWQLPLASFAERLEDLREECFGPAGLVVTYREVRDLLPVLEALGGTLTGSIHASPGEHAEVALLATVLRRTAGRLVHNGWPTGVAVCAAMHHGGPWPATTSARHTSVGATAVDRWLTPVAYENWPAELLPPELQDGNPLGIPRLTGF
ncbi:aldehyde dehydrogenase (NADP(+)) [Kitasatospora sp. NBC_00240]|uniref:aldehyde dehydrogenase (NADP(+)) n=1 Tax=Kitasatospora sp. NBC_00240 TaxID=2903567 RepID=UPI0022591F91|nr:aldehyde dehydrogenase (NADP(+)) [Kitasatospora sp. NBC_00240]MCX5214715.1 aldehyde dehydrogenase (NADP(+)) [Kitasatospora sp. NBC_00240]